MRIYQETGKSTSHYDMNSRLPFLKRDHEWLKEAHSQVLQQSLGNLATAYQNFFSKRKGFPRFKQKRSRQSIAWAQGVKIVAANNIYLPKVGHLRAVLHRQIVGKIKTVTVVRHSCNHYYAVMAVDDGLAFPVISTAGKSIGVDFGINDLAVTSDGSKFENVRHIRKFEKNLNRKQRNLSRKKKGSSGWEKSRQQVARVYERILNARRDGSHKLSRKIVDDNQVVIIEDLNVRGLGKNHKMAKAINDVGWGYLKRLLVYKAERQGKALIKVDRWYPSSKTCSKCGHIVKKIELNVRAWDCPKCFVHHDRDVNAAINIRNEGLRMLAAGIAATAGGGDVRHKPGRRSTVNAVAIEARSRDVR